jgi:lysophospholipase L1-like esterase
MKYPNKNFEIINVGLPSETVSGLSEAGHAGGKFPRPDLHERLDRVLAQIKPDLVFACYGMNDGIYMPFDDHRFKKYKKGITWLHNKVVKSGASIIHVTPPIYDEVKGPAYANVLDLYSDWLISLRYTLKWEVIDIHWPMKKYLEERRQLDSTFVLAKDGIHPDETGHFLIAKHLLFSLGEKELSYHNNIQETLQNYRNSTEILNLGAKKQAILKDAWLTQIGHKRPGMNKGLPMKEANQLIIEISKQISQLVR